MSRLLFVILSLSFCNLILTREIARQRGTTETENVSATFSPPSEKHFHEKPEQSNTPNVLDGKLPANSLADNGDSVTETFAPVQPIINRKLDSKRSREDTFRGIRSRTGAYRKRSTAYENGESLALFRIFPSPPFCDNPCEIYSPSTKKCRPVLNCES